MIDAPGFHDWPSMQNSEWLAGVRQTMHEGQWPKECKRCQDTENMTGESVRLSTNQRHQVLSRLRPDYLVLGGVLDNVCNSACQSCNANHSTKIGSLSGKKYIRIDNSDLLSRVPLDRAVELDISGGEPTASPRYQKLMHNLPANVKMIRVNTNGSRVLPNIETILDKQILTTVTISLDGIGSVHDYVRWPIKWQDFVSVVDEYRVLARRHKHLRVQFWTVLHALNIADFDNIKNFAKSVGIEHSWAWLHNPSVLDARFSNHLTLAAKHMQPDFVATLNDNQSDLDQFIRSQDDLRGISIGEFM